jgi:hypothetical protein
VNVLVLFVAFLFLLLVSVSLPITKSIYLLSMTANVDPRLPLTSVATNLRFGVWGFCAFRCVRMTSINLQTNSNNLFT